MRSRLKGGKLPITIATLVSPMYESYPIAAHPAPRRFEFFESVIERLFCPMQAIPRYPAWQPFEGTVEASRLGTIRLARVATPACAVRRRPQDIARLSEAAYLIKFQLKGEARWMQRGREVNLRPGDFVVCSVTEPYSLEFRGPYEMPVLALSEDAMRRLSPDPDQFLGMRMAGEDADCGLLTSFVAQVVTRMNHLSQPMIARVEANVVDLLGAVLCTRARRGAPSSAQLLAQIKAFISEHLRNPKLGPPVIAAAFGISTRQVHTLFETEPMTIGRYIRSRRANECRRVLQAATEHPISLTDIALTWGYYDLSHMTRCFRAEFGATPSELRAGGMRD